MTSNRVFKLENVQLLKCLFEPFPMQNKGKKHFMAAFYVGLFVSFFLFVFDPFNLHVLPMGAFFAALCFGAVTFFCTLIYDYVSNNVIRLNTDLPSWTLWRWLVYMLGLISVIALGNIAMLSIISENTISGNVIWQMFKNTLMVGITPITALGFQIQYQNNKTHQQTAEEIELKKYSSENKQACKEQQIITLPLSSNEYLTLNLNTILYVESLQNYIQINYQDYDTNEVKSAVIRSTLRAFHQQNGNGLFQCHRCFLVNLEHVAQVSGNAQGLKLSLTDQQDNFVPVSRRYIAEFKQRFNA